VGSQARDKMIFRAKTLGNEPELQIKGTDIDHILSSRFFDYYYYPDDGKFDVVADPELTIVKVVETGESFDQGVLIGWIEHEI